MSSVDNQNREFTTMNLFRMMLLLATITLSASLQAAEFKDLKSLMAAEKARLGAKNPGYSAQGNSTASVCIAMKSVGLGCSYNERGEVVLFLYKNGVNMFPCKGGSNPYTKNSCSETYHDEYNYIGQAGQNKTLADSIRKNRALFSGGNLTAENAKKWRL